MCVCVCVCVCKRSVLRKESSDTGIKSNFLIWQHFRCTSSNIIYRISCSECGTFYTGETGRRLSDRFSAHVGCVRTNDVEKPAARLSCGDNHFHFRYKIFYHLTYLWG